MSTSRHPHRTRTRLRLILVCSVGFGVLPILAGCDPFTNRSVSPQPEIVDSRAGFRLSRMAAGSRFSYTDLSFYGGKLYAGSTIGLLEYDSGRLTKLLRWTNETFDVVDRVWADNVNGNLWLDHSRLGKLVRFDGNTWSFVDYPEKLSGGYTRGDMLQSFKTTNGKTSFWIHGANDAWRWRADRQSWSREPNAPEKDCHVTTETHAKDIRCFAALLPLSESVVTIMHREYMSSFDFYGDPTKSAAPKPPSDRVYLRHGDDWKEISTETAVDFVTEDFVVGQNEIFVLTIYDKLFRITTTKIEPLETPGKVEAMTITSSGSLLVSFLGQGIYEYKSAWQKRFDCPYPAGIGEHFSKIAEDSGRVAFAISPHPDKDVSSTLWLSAGNEMRVVPLEL